jgi:hypothetical protein
MNAGGLGIIQGRLMPWRSVRPATETAGLSACSTSLDLEAET